MTAAIPNRISAKLCQSIALTFSDGGAPRLRGNRCNALFGFKEADPLFCSLVLSEFRCRSGFFGFAVRLALFGFALNLARCFAVRLALSVYRFRWLSIMCGSVATPPRVTLGSYPVVAISNRPIFAGRLFPVRWSYPGRQAWETNELVPFDNAYYGSLASARSYSGRAPTKRPKCSGTLNFEHWRLG